MNLLEAIKKGLEEKNPVAIELAVSVLSRVTLVSITVEEATALKSLL